MEKAEISVILPFYKDAATLDKAVESIVVQTFKDWELILVSNNACVDSLNIAEKWVQKDNRIKLVFEKQQGIAHALNHGLQLAEAPFIARMDADDLSFLMRFEVQLQFLKSHPEIDVVSCQTAFASDTERSEGFELFVEWQNRIISVEEHFEMRFVESPLAHPSVMFRKELIEKYGYYSIGELPEDYELWLRWMNEGVTFYKIPEKLFLWCDSQNRLSRSHPNYSKEAFLKVRCQYLALWLKQNSIDKERQIIIWGASARSRNKAAYLKAHGIEVFAYTDIKKRHIAEPFIAFDALRYEPPFFFIPFVAKRGAREEIAAYLNKLGYKVMVDYIMAG